MNEDCVVRWNGAQKDENERKRVAGIPKYLWCGREALWTTRDADRPEAGNGLPCSRASPRNRRSVASRQEREGGTEGEGRFSSPPPSCYT